MWTTKLARSYTFDVAILGGGPAGYTATLKAAQKGYRAICIDNKPALGGTCLNDGCIPAKALLRSSQLFYEARTQFAQHGITHSGVSVDLAAMMRRKQQAVDELTQNVSDLFSKYKAEHLYGTGSLQNANTVLVDNTSISAKHLILAVGSKPVSPHELPIDERRILSSTGALTLQEVPRRLAVIGGGVVGLELGSVFQRLGSEVIIVESGDSIAPFLDRELSKAYQKVLEKQGLQFILESRVIDGSSSSSGVRIELEVSSGKDVPSVLEADYALVAVGRQPNTRGLGLDRLDITTDKQGFINVNKNLQILRYDNMYAIGDCVKGPMLAHKAQEEALQAVEHIGKTVNFLNYDAVPWVIYTAPEAAFVGKTEEDLKRARVPYKKGVFPMLANSRARANHDAEGFVKVLAHAESNQLLGCHILSSVAGELIMEAVLAFQYGGSCEDVARTCHAHPCYSEALKEACLATVSKTVNF